MSDLTFNKIAGAALAMGLAVVGLGQLSAGIFTAEAPAKPGYLVEVEDEGGAGPAAVETPPDWGTVLPVADVAAGEAVFAKCKSCHTVEAGGANGIGPNIHGAPGRKPGAVAGFAYSSGMTEFGAKQAVWNDDSLNDFLKSPAKYISGTKMSFVGLKKQDERINLIAYLRSQGGTLAVPAPDPARAPAAAAAAAPADGAPPAAAGEPTTTEAAPATLGTAGQGTAQPVAKTTK